MDKAHIRTDTFIVKKHNLRIFRVFERGKAVLLWTSEQQAARYVQRLHIKRLLVSRKRR